jgi:CRISPR system Cascade subunit CasA
LGVNRKMAKFNIVREPCLPCLQAPGTGKTLSVLDVLHQAHTIREVRDASPLVTAALHRLLLAILHRAVKGPENLEHWADLWRRGRFEEAEIGRYLREWSPRFDLFDEKHPFFQVAHFEVSSPNPVTQLSQDLAQGNNPTLFDHTTDEQASVVPFDTCARWLVAKQAFALGGGKGATSNMFGEHPYLSHAPAVLGAVVLLRGDNLFETLMLNLLRLTDEYPVPRSGQDVPAWERDVPIETPRERPCRGWLDLVTWQSRCVRLIPEQGGVRNMYFAQGEALSAASRPRDPMFFHRQDRKEPDQYFPVRLDPEKALWRESDSLFAFSVQQSRARETRPLAFGQMCSLIEEGIVNFDNRKTFRCSILGLSNDKAKVLRWAHEDLPVPRALLRDDMPFECLKAGLQASEGAGGALRFALKVLSQNLLGFNSSGEVRQADPGNVRKLADGLQGETVYWAALDLPFRKLMDGLGMSPEAALEEWRETVVLMARRAFHSASDNCLGRGARELKARVEAERALNTMLWKLEPMPLMEGGPT